MVKKSLTFLAPAIVVGIIVLAMDALYIVQENEQVIITQFGRFISSSTEPGLNVKTPFVQDIVVYDNRLLDHDIPPQEIVTKDKRKLLVDNFTKWRIVDPELFFKRARTIAVAKDRLKDIIYSELRLDFGAHDLAEIVSGERANIMAKVTERSNSKVQELNMGVEIVDVRIKRADFPTPNQKAVFDRMRAERNRIASQFRSEGKEAAQRIRATTDKEKTIILAEAYKNEQKLRGEGDAQAIKITASAYGKDTNFYEFIRSLDAYKRSISKSDTMVISQDSPFLRYLK